VRYRFTLHDAVASGDLQAVQRLLGELPAGAINAYDEQSRKTPLIEASSSTSVGVEILSLLIANGAELEIPAGREPDKGRTALSFATQAGDPDTVSALLDAGANLHYSWKGYGVLLDATCRRDLFGDQRLLELLALLIQRGARIDDVTQYNESALRVLSNRGRFDAVALLLAAGADASQLGWAPLHHSVAIGTLVDMDAAVAQGANLEAKDFWGRTPLLVAILSGDIAKVAWLLEHGAQRDAAGRCGKPPLFYAIEGQHEAMLRWLLAEGFSPALSDQFGTPVLSFAARARNFTAVRILLEAGMSPNEQVGHLNALYNAADREIALSLLEAGADPNDLPFETRRALVGLVSEPTTRLLWASPDEFENGWRRRFGVFNPEEHTEPFWRAMVISGVYASVAADAFPAREDEDGEPIWCAQRNGQSITFLADGRIIQIGGEHEDFYDPDFCIYNDVFVHEPDGSFRIYGYPEADFPPTDFHTATLVGDRIYIIGSLGYQSSRSIGSTPVHALDIHTLKISRVDTTGPAPGWIFKHRDALISPNAIAISGGSVATLPDGKETHAENAEVHLLDLDRLEWRVATDGPRASS